MTIETDTATIPAHWLCYLVNDDASGLDDGEAEQIDAYLSSALPGWTVSGPVDDAEPYFTWSYDLHDGGISGAGGGNVVEVVIYRNATEG